MNDRAPEPVAASAAAPDRIDPEAPSVDIDPSSPLGPLRLPVFRLLWLTWLAANVTMWMNDVASAWMMTSLAPTPSWVALVQTASTLPVFLLALPSGAMADIVDRKKFLMGTQLWLAAIACVMCALVLMDWMTPPLLLFMTFCNGVGLAMRWPVFAAIIPEVLPRKLLSQGLALNSVSMNGSRIIGPLVAGAIIASAGSAWVFVINAALSLVAAYTITRWQREHKESPLGRERLRSAMRVGLQFMRQSPRLRGTMLRIALFFLHATAIMSLLPLLARALPGGKAGTFTVLLAAMGTGAITAALNMPRLRRLMPLNRVAIAGTALMAMCSVVLAFAQSVTIAVPAMFVAGVAWISSTNSLTLQAQMALPDWVRARGMSIYQMALMGSTAAGAALWGQVATWLTIHDALLISAASSAITMGLAYRFVRDRATEEDLTPSQVLRVPDMPPPARPGRVMVRIEYRIDPTREADFRRVMERTRRTRLAQGALEWHLLQDLSEPGRWVEQIIDENWVEHLRRFDRTTAADAALRERRLQFHLGDEAPRVTRYVIEE